MVTVVTATYNLLVSGREEHFRQCLESVHTQTYPNIEHIIIDGASTDGTLTLLRQYEQKGWISIFSEADLGIYDAFNKGLQIAKGKYIAFLNSDDLWHDPRGVETSVKALEEENADFSYSSIIFLSGKLQKRIIPFISSFFYGTPCCHQTVFTKAEHLRRVGGFNLNYKVFADGDVIAKLILSGAKGVYIPLCFTTFRDGGFANSCDIDSLEHERKELYLSLYQNIASEKEANSALEKELSTSFKNTLMQKIHPDIARELNHYCRWSIWDRAWHYQARPKSGELITPIIFLLDHLVPGWDIKLRRIYRIIRPVSKQ